MIEIICKMGLKFPRIVLRTAVHLVISESEDTKSIKSDLMSLDHCVSLQSWHRNFCIFQQFCSSVGNCFRPFKISEAAGCA